MKLVAATKADETVRGLCMVLGGGPLNADAIMALAPDLRTFASGKKFAAWIER